MASAASVDKAMFHQTGGVIREGDTVIFALGCFKLLKSTMRHGTVLQTRYGAIRHSDFIDKLQYGCRYQCARGYVHALSPTPELWTASLLHRTQIIYSHDISQIVFNLDLHPGSKVIEAGTGSGSLSHAIVRTVAPNGHLYTFDFHEMRSKIAEQEFRDHNYQSHLVSCHHRDVCQDGFVISGDDNSFKVDAVFLDLPSPWKAVGHATSKLVSGGRLCVFSPCIEQIQQTAQVMREQGFAYVKTLECIQQRYTVKNYKPAEVPLTRTAFDTKKQPSAEQEKEPEGLSDAEQENEAELIQPVQADSVTSVLPLSPTPGHTGYLLFGRFFRSDQDKELPA